MTDKHAQASAAASASAIRGRAGIIAAYATAFFASMCILILELVAGRVIAKFLGQSLYTWTSIIGVILAGLSVGNYIGGRLADRYSAVKALSVLLFLSSVAAVSILFINNMVGESEVMANLFVKNSAGRSETTDDFNWPPRIALHVFITFFLPCTILGTIGPVAAKYALDQGRAIGRTVGNIYAWGSLGAIIGTFLTGFWLLAVMRVSRIIFTVSGALLFISILYAIPGFLLVAKNNRSK